MQQFRHYEDSYGVVIRPGWIVNDVSMTIGKRRTVITYRADLPAEVARLAVATMIAVLDLGWPGSRFRLRYPLPGDPYDGPPARCRYCRPTRLARRRLLPDNLLRQAEREEWSLGEIQEACGLDAWSIEARVQEYKEAGRKIVSMAAFSTRRIYGV